MTQCTEKDVRKWMIFHVEDYSNATNLAEAAAHEFDHDEWLDDPDHWVWELAIEVLPGD